MAVRQLLVLWALGAVAAAGLRSPSTSMSDRSFEDWTPRFDLKATASPIIKLRKRIDLFKASRMSVGCDVDVLHRIVTVDMRCKDTLVGGTLGLTNLTTLSWKKTWLLPGIMDFATKVEATSSVDLRTGRYDAKLRLGLRELFASKGLSLVQETQLTPYARLDWGFRLRLPNELEVDAEDVRSRTLSPSLRDARCGIDFDTLDLCIDL